MLTYHHYKFKLKLSKSVKDRLTQWLGTCRYVVNVAKETKEYAYKQGINLGRYSLTKQLKDIRKEFDWIRDVPCEVLENAIFKQDDAYKAFYKGIRKYPRWAKRSRYKSLTFRFCKRSGNDGIILTKLGEVKFHNWCNIPEDAQYRTCVVKKEFDGWYATITTKRDSQPVELRHESQVIGLDWGVSRFYTLSTGEYAENPRFFQKYKRQFRYLYRSLSRKQKGSHNWRNVKRQLARVHGKLARTRLMWHHKLAYSLVQQYDTIVVEDLKIKNLTKSAKGTKENPGNNVRQKAGLNREILSTAPGQFFRILKEKCKNEGVRFVKVKPNHTSQECPECGHVSKENRKTQAQFKCKNCGHETNADLNAAKNIMSRYLTTIGANVKHRA